MYMYTCTSLLFVYRQYEWSNLQDWIIQVRMNTNLLVLVPKQTGEAEITTPPWHKLYDKQKGD